MSEPLRAWQVAALRGVSRTWQTHTRALVVAPTGAGKTVFFSEIARRRRDAKRGRTLVLAPMIDLVDQAAGVLEKAGLSVQVEQANKIASVFPGLLGGSDAVVACCDSLKGRRLERWPEDAFGTVIADEAHCYAAPSRRAILDRFTTAKILGVTATPMRGDNVALGHVFPELASEYPMLQAISDGVLCPIQFRAVTDLSLDMSTVRTSSTVAGRDFNADDLDVALQPGTLERCGKIAELAGERQTLVFCPTVKSAHEHRRVMGRIVGVDACNSVDGGASKDEREIALQRFRYGRTRFLFNCALYTMGVDLPSTACVAVIRITKSRTLLQQMIGRGTRVSPGKTDLLVLLLHPSGEGHNLAQPIDLFAGDDLPDDDRARANAAIMSGEDAVAATRRATEAADARKRARERDTGERLDLQVRARVRVVDLFGQLGIDESPGDARGPRATDRQREALARITGREVGERELSRKQAGSLLDAVADRRKRGLCTLKQARQLAKHGLRTDLTFVEAGAVMTVLAENGWRMTPTVAERFGT